MTTKNDFKNLLGGIGFGIDVKYGAKQFWQRIAIIATMNENLGILLPSAERNAFYSSDIV